MVPGTNPQPFTVRKFEPFLSNPVAQPKAGIQHEPAGVQIGGKIRIQYMGLIIGDTLRDHANIETAESRDRGKLQTVDRAGAFETFIDVIFILGGAGTGN